MSDGIVLPTFALLISENPCLVSFSVARETDHGICTLFASKRLLLPGLTTGKTNDF
jgi:hypothetical protein